MDELIYAVALQKALGYGSRKTAEILKAFSSFENVFSVPESELKLTGFLNLREVAAIASRDFSRAESILKTCQKQGITVIPYGSPSYPKRLAAIPDPPCVLYVYGDLPKVDEEVTIAMVGTREATEYGHTVARNLSYDIAMCGGIIVSGGALGIDSDCHTGALLAGGQTLAVLGTGLFTRYLMKNSDLRKTISRNGALISEFEPGMTATKYTFPMRNRIISGLSLGTVVIEAGEKSGSLITASHAAEQGRDVFALPGNILAPTFQGTNKLLREGAKPVFGAIDVLEDYEKFYPGKLNLSAVERTIGQYTVTHRYPPEIAVDPTAAQTQTRSKKLINNGNNAEPDENFLLPAAPEGLSADGRLVYNSFKKSEMLLDELVSGSKLPVSKLLTVLTELEIQGAVASCAGNRYKIII